MRMEMESKRKSGKDEGETKTRMQKKRKQEKEKRRMKPFFFYTNCGKQTRERRLINMCTYTHKDKEGKIRQQRKRMRKLWKKRDHTQPQRCQDVMEYILTCHIRKSTGVNNRMNDH